MLPPPGLVFHFEYLKGNIRVEEPELAEMAITQLKWVFPKVSKQEQQSLLERLLALKTDAGIQGI